MKEKSMVIREQKDLRKVMRFVFLIALVILMGQSESYGMSSPYDPNKNGICNSDVMALARTFKSMPSSKQGLCDQPKKISKSNLDTPIEITYQDLITAYDINNDLEYYYSDDYGNYEMNIGKSDLVNPQHWEMPDCELEDWDYGEGILPSETPYWNYFPSATHCKLYEYEDEDYYEYYELNEQSAILIGAVDLYLDEDEKEVVEVDSIDLLLTPLTLDINTSFISQDSLCIDDTSYVYYDAITPYGFGTLTTPEGDLEVLAMLNDFNEWIYAGGEIIEEYNQPIIVFISKEGHQVNIWLEEDSDVEGDVTVDWIEYTRIIDNTKVAKANDRLPANFELFQNYPNPFNPGTNIRYEMKEKGHVSLKVFDQLGKQVAVLSDEDKPAGTYEVKFDGSKLSSGSYFYQLQTGNSKAIRKLMLIK